MNLKGIIFDVDGTIADTEDIHRQAFNQTFKEFALNWHWSVSDYHQLLSISGGQERFKKCLNGDLALKKTIFDPGLFIQKLHQRKSENYRSLLINGDIPLRTGIARLLYEAQEQKILLGIATSSSTANLRALLNNTLDIEPEDLFDAIVSSDIVSDKKPAPVVYQCALARLGLNADCCVAIEDTSNGNLAALNAMLKTIITTHQYTAKSDFTGASIVTDSLGEPDQPLTIQAGYDCRQSYIDTAVLDDIVRASEQKPLSYVVLPDLASNFS